MKFQLQSRNSSPWPRVAAHYLPIHRN